MSSLLLPLVSTGNVPQLATDLILHSLAPDFAFVQELDSMFLFPFVGPLDYVRDSQANLYQNTQDKTFTTPLELFHSPSLKLYVVQQRSPVIQPYDNCFCKNVLVPLVETLKISQLVVFDATDSVDEIIGVPQLRKSPYSLGICDLSHIDDISSEFEEKLQIDDSNTQSVNKTLFKFTDNSFQSGIATEQFIFKLCYHLLHSPVICGFLKEIRYFNTYVQEGDNSEDAAAACGQLPHIISGFPKITQYKTPISWEGVYGVRNAPITFEEGLYI
ncbi:LADA_0H18756g1_1 [Lachancea dasiensis]|uniref:Proteasome assembly chaperone 2 n=1 Tax=Lachancea dasiensis TaxID=1072105 RepID=A0A1G4K614_9SACH|nr:LADA_0H18756g1_1 [Lachancea dasiensis]